MEKYSSVKEVQKFKVWRLAGCTVRKQAETGGQARGEENAT